MNFKQIRETAFRKTTAEMDALLKLPTGTVEDLEAGDMALNFELADAFERIGFDINYLRKEAFKQPKPAAKKKAVTAPDSYRAMAGV
jgi:hypothetical protein